MTKRLFVLLLALVLTFSLLPAAVFAADLTPAKINLLYEGTTHELDVYLCGGDIYFSGDDLWSYTYYDYENDGKKAVFTRGVKKIIIELDEDEFTIQAAGTGVERDWTNAPVKMGDQWYFSGSDLLPWLNVTCDVENGCLMIVPDEWSFWDIYADLDMGDYCISYSSVCLELSWDSKVVKALQYSEDNLGELILEGTTIEDEYGGNADDYYDLFEGFLLDKSQSAKTAEQIHEYYGLGLDVLSLMLPACEDLFTALEIYNDGALYACNYAAFTQDDSNKMDVIHTIFQTTDNSGETKQLNDGANLIILAYSSWWSNILTNFVLNLDEKVVAAIQDKITSGIPMADALLLVADVATKEQQSLNKRIKLMAPTLNLYSQGCGVLDGNHSAHVVMLENSEHILLLSLYAAQQNAMTMADYCEDKELYGLADKYAAQARDVAGWIDILNAASLCIVNDSIHYYNEDGEPDQDVYKDAYTAKLLKLFSQLDICQPVGATASTVEYAMLHTFLMEEGVNDATWQIVSYDDGYDLYVLYGYATDAKGKQIGMCFTADASTENARAYQTDDFPTYDNPNLTDFVLSGKPDTLYQELDRYFENRSHYIGTQAVDLNGDGKADRVYVLVSAMNQWGQRFELRGNDAVNPFQMTGELTLVTAEQASNGLRIRVTYLPPADDTTYSYADGQLTIGSSTYAYQPEGKAFVAVAPPTVAADGSLFSLLLMTPEQMRQVTAGYDEWSADEDDIYADANYGSVALELHFEPIDGVFRCDSLKTRFEGTELMVTDTISSTATVEEVMAALQPTFSWDLKDSDSDAESVHYYHTNFYYDAPTQTVWYVTLDAQTFWDDEKDGWGERVFAGIQFSYSDSLSEELPDWLVNSYPAGDG